MSTPSEYPHPFPLITKQCTVSVPSLKLFSTFFFVSYLIFSNGLEYFLIKKADWAESIALSTGKDCIETNTVIFTSK